MNLPLSAEMHREGEWFVAFCPEIPEANGQGRTQEECIESLRQAILLLLEDRREESHSRHATSVPLMQLAKTSHRLFTECANGLAKSAG